MLKSFQARLQYMKWEIPDVQAGLHRDRGTRGQIANSYWIMEKARGFQKSIYFCFIDYSKVLDSVDHNKVWKILRGGSTRQFICPLRNLYVNQEAAIRTGHGKMDWFKIEKGVCQDCLLFLLISLLCRVHHVKYQAGWITSWNQDCWEKCQ